MFRMITFLTRVTHCDLRPSVKQVRYLSLCTRFVEMKCEPFILERVSKTRKDEEGEDNTITMITYVKMHCDSMITHSC